MRLLLDTHAFLWFVLNAPELSPEACNLMIDPDNDLFLSPASHWEIFSRFAHKIQSNQHL